MPHILIIAYGNPLRSDDGVARRVAELLQRRLSSDDVDIVILHQLAPELAERSSQCDRVIFVDAADGPGTPGEVRIQELSLASGKHPEVPRFCHAVSPATVLNLTAQLYGAKPRAFSATVVGENFSHGERLSPSVEAAIPELASRVEALLTSTIPALSS